MGPFELYLLKSVIGLSILYCFYLIFLRGETFYSWNRIFLILTIMAAFCIPLLHFSIENNTSGMMHRVFEPLTITGNNLAISIPDNSGPIGILSIIYICGVTCFSLQFLFRLAKILFLYIKYPTCKYKGFTAVILDNNPSPFTFFNLLFIDRSEFESGKANEIIVHETAHRDGYHSIDVILTEIITIFQWFNPFIWMLRGSLKSEHEFIADNKVLNEGFDLVMYQMLLVEKSIGLTFSELTNNFNSSILKKRLKMMTIHKSNAWIRVKYLLSLPVILLTIAMLSVNINTFAQDNVSLNPDKEPEYIDGGMQGMIKHITQNIKYPENADKSRTSAQVFVQFKVDKQGKVGDVEIVKTKAKINTQEIVVVGYASEAEGDGSVRALNDEAIRVVSSLGDFYPAEKDGKKVGAQLTIPINFMLE